MMDEYNFIIRFDDDSHSLSAQNGLPINQIGELLSYLGKALNLKDETLTLSQILGNCYALELTTPVYSIYSTMKSVHECISNNDFLSLNTEQKKYAKKIGEILGTKYRMNTYDRDKSFDYKILNINSLIEVSYFYEIDDVKGTITAIGSNSFDSKIHIKLDSLNYDIYISTSQEAELLKHYKKSVLSLRINKKIDNSTDKVVSAELIEFSVEKKSKSRFVDEAEHLMESMKNRSVFPGVKDSAKSVRHLRG